MIEYIKTGVLREIRRQVPGSVTGESVTIKVRRNSDNYWFNFATDAFVAAEPTPEAAMTFDAGEVWKESFTPSAAGTYSCWITYEGAQVAYIEYEAMGNPAPESVTGSEVTIAEVKEAMGITGTAQDTILANLLARVIEDIENNVIFRKLSVQTHTDYYNGGTSRIFLKNYPLVAITSINDDPFYEFASDTLIEATDYYTFNDAGEIVLKAYNFMSGEKNVKIVYSAGYSTFPRDLKEAIIKMVYAEYLTLRASGNVIEGSNDDKPKRLREEALKSLQQYVRMR